jgi:general secretion pathway protein D
MRRVAGVVLIAVLLGGCAAGRAFRRGQEAVRVADWDAAVTYFTKAVQEDPDSAEYKIHLQRAQGEASRAHLDKAQQLEEKDQLEGALAEYRRALEYDPQNRIAGAKVAQLEQMVRERLEATRPKPRIEQLQQQARGLNQPPLLNPASREPLRVQFNNAGLRDILNFIGSTTGINITYDQQFVDKGYTVNLEGVTLEEALQQILSANQYYYKVLNPRTIIVIPDQPQKHTQYDEMVVRVFYISHADATELAQLINTVMRIPQLPLPPVIMPNKTANTITVRGTAPVVDVIEKVIRANDKPRAEVILDVEILEVNRARLKRYGINLSSYSLQMIFSPEVAPPNVSTSQGVSAPPPFNLNTISQGVSTADFYLGVPTAVVNFLEQDNQTKTLAKPQLRGAEGQKMTLNLGQDIPVLQTVFGAAAAGGFATIPQTSYNYRKVGVNLEITPRVTYEGEILLELSVEDSALGASVDVGGQAAPSFLSRQVQTHLRLREGEANLLAGLVRQDSTRNRSGFPGLVHVPVFKQLFSGNDINEQDTDIVMLITPHIVRSHELTAQDLGSIYIGTQGNVGLGGPPPLIAAPGGEAPAPQAPETPPATAGVGNSPPPGVPRPPVAGEAGAQPANRPAPPGTSPVPTPVTPLPPAATATPPSAPPAGQPTTAPGGEAGAPPGAAPAPVPPLPGAAQPQAGAAGAQPPTAPTTTPAQIIVSPPGTTFQVAGGPYTMPVSINNASRISVLTLTITFNPAVLRVRTVQDGTFMRQGGITASFTPRIDNASGRVDIAMSRAGDQTGASGAGLLAALLFDAVAPGNAIINVSGVANTPDGAPLQLAFSPVTVTVR